MLLWNQFTGVIKLRQNRAVTVFGRWTKIILLFSISAGLISTVLLLSFVVLSLLSYDPLKAPLSLNSFGGVSSSLLPMLAHVELMGFLCKSAISYINKTEFNCAASSNWGSHRERQSHTHSRSRTNPESPINLKCMFWTAGRNLSAESKPIQGEHANSTEKHPPPEPRLELGLRSLPSMI